MNVTPAVLPDGSAAPPVAIPGDGGLIIRCVAYSPASASGRNVDVFIPAAFIDLFLLAFRDKARDNRNRSGPSTDIESPLLSAVSSLVDTIRGAAETAFDGLDDAEREEAIRAAEDMIRRWANPQQG